MILRAVEDAQCNTKNHRNSLLIMIVSLIITKMIMIIKSITNIHDNRDDNYFKNITNNKDNNNYSNDENTKGLYSWSIFCIFSLNVTAIIIFSFCLKLLILLT